MGQYWSNESPAAHDADENWPWVWAIIDPEQLDWKVSLAPEEITAIAQTQSQLPVQITETITETVFLSDARRAHDVERLKELRITHVLNVAGKGSRGPVEEYAEAGVEVLEIDAEDEEGYPMLADHMQEARAFIEKVRSSGGRCVVHCAAGINRSGVIVAAEKMLSEQMTVLEIVAYCRRARGNIFLCNQTFVGELVSVARLNDLLGPKPGEPGSRVAGNPPPVDASRAWRTDTRAFKSQDVRDLFK